MQINQISLLVVDQQSNLRSSLCYQLELAGYAAIYQAKSYSDALDVLKRKKVSLVISELTQPTNGITLLEMIRKDEKHANMPFIMFTDMPDRESALKAIALGVNDFLVKPFTAKRLTEHILKVLKNKDTSTNKKSITDDKKQIDTNESSLSIEKTTILVVDDSPDNLELLSELFNENYKIKIATGGEKALSICMSDGPPDLILLDVMMPDMDGFEVARRLREHHACSHTPIIFISTVTENESRNKGLSLGAIDYISKPIDPELLNLRVNNLMTFVEHRKQMQSNFDNLRELEALRKEVKDLRSRINS